MKPKQKSKSKTKFKEKTIRKLALVRLTKDSHAYCGIFGCRPDATFIYLGDIAQMPGHGVFIGHHSGSDSEFRGRLFAGYHTESFVELTDEEA